MKKKYFLGIVAILMVIALTLTGCGQNGEQNVEATGPGDNSDAEVSDRDESPTVEEPKNGDTKTPTMLRRASRWKRMEKILPRTKLRRRTSMASLSILSLLMEFQPKL